MKNPRVVTGIAVAVVALLAVGLWAFQPWKVFTSSEVDEALPTVASEPSSEASSPSKSPVGDSGAPRELASGKFVTLEHSTSGTAKVIELEDGSRFVRFDDLATSDGPDLHVWITDQTSGGEWGKFDDGRYIKLGKLKATHGNQNYAIPADADLAGMKSVVIWCDRFNVGFGSAGVRL